MFKYTNFPDKSARPLKSPISQKRSTSIPKPTQAADRPNLGSCTVPKPKSPITPRRENSISERYTNSTYNRLPSPRGRFQTLTSAVKENPPPFVVGKPSGVEEKQKPARKPSERVKTPSSRLNPLPRTNTSLVKQSRSDIINKKRLLEVECQKNNTHGEVEIKSRPKTSNCSRTNSHLDQSVLNTVESVLSQAVMQQGKIDETNIDKIINSMRNSLFHQKNLDEELSDIDIELKPSRTTLNEINLSTEHYTEQKSKPLGGIIRKDNLSTKPERKPYMKIYDEPEPPSKQVMNRNLSVGEDESLLYVDIPDLVFPNFPLSKKNDGKGKLKPNIEITVSKQNIQIETSKRSGFSQQLEVGDFQAKENHFWSSSEDSKLRDYVESLIQNMKGQMNSDNSVVETEGEIDSEGTVCKSFCVCRVCVSKNAQSLKQKPSTLEKPSILEKQSVADEKQKPLQSTVGRLARSGESKQPTKRGANNRLRLLEPLSKDDETGELCKVIRNTNPNFKPESSSLNTSLLHMSSSNKGTSYTVVDAVENPEAGDDMYLQRRIRKAPSRKSSAKVK